MRSESTDAPLHAQRGVMHTSARLEEKGDLPNIAPSGRKIYTVLHLLDEIFFFHLILHLSDENFEIC